MVLLLVQSSRGCTQAVGLLRNSKKTMQTMYENIKTGMTLPEGRAGVDLSLLSAALDSI